MDMQLENDKEIKVFFEEFYDLWNILKEVDQKFSA
jgi:hypothetical protein